jgi:hypothetical protein
MRHEVLRSKERHRTLDKDSECSIHGVTSLTTLTQWGLLKGGNQPTVSKRRCPSLVDAVVRMSLRHGGSSGQVNLTLDLFSSPLEQCRSYEGYNLGLSLSPSPER